MIKNYFKIAWRNIIRHKSYSVINIAGLAIGIAACLLIFTVVQYELSFEKFQPQYKNIYRIVMQQKLEDGISYTDGSPLPLPDALQVDFPQAKVAALHASYGSQITVGANGATASANDKKFIEGLGVVFIQPQFFDIFSYKWLAGNKSVLAKPNVVVIDRSRAIKYFGDWKKATGKIIKMDNFLTLKIGGVIEDAPANTDFSLKVLVSYLTLKQNAGDYGLNDAWNSNSSNHQVFMLLPPNQSATAINAQLKTFTAKHYDGRNALQKLHFLQPLADMHFDTRFGNSLGDHITNKATIRTLLFIAVLIILMASINFVNLSTAQSVSRSKEVGIRKVLGSSRTQLIKQSLGETGLIVLLAVFIALCIAKLALPYLTHIASVPDDIGLFNVGTFMFLLAVVPVIILISGIYPALVVSGFRPVLALKNKINAASIGGVSLRRVLVVAQFSIAQLLIIGTIVAVKQMNFVNTADLGFNKEAVLIIPGSGDKVSLQKIDGLKQQFLQIPGVKAVSFMSDQPSSDNNWSNNFYFNNSTTEIGYMTFLKYGDADYFKTFGLRFKAGHGYAPSDTTREVVVNETFVKKLGIQNLSNAIGKTVRMGGSLWYPIVGVVEDFKTNSLREAVKPIIILPRKVFGNRTAVKLATSNFSATVAQVQKKWESTFPEYAYTGYFLDENIAQFYKQENQLALVYNIFALIAICISCLGLYGLVSFMVVQRTKEVGVRKVLGASISSIVYLFSKEFMLLIAVSVVIAIPAAVYMMNGWLQNFAYRIQLTAGIFIAAVAASLIIAWLTVGYKAIKAALANPVKSLRSE